MSTVFENISYTSLDKMKLCRPGDTPEDIIKLYNAPANEDRVKVYNASTPADRYRCPVSTPVLGGQRRGYSGLPGPRQIFLTQVFNDDTYRPTNHISGKHVLGYYFLSTRNGDSTLRHSTNNPWLDNLCARPVNEILSKSHVQFPMVKGRPFWSHTKPTQGEQSLLKAWEQNSNMSRASRGDSSRRGKHWSHPGLVNISDSAFPDEVAQVTSAGGAAPRYGGHTFKLSNEPDDHSDDDTMMSLEKQLEGPVVVSCTIQELPLKSARSEQRKSYKPAVRLPKLKKVKKKTKDQTPETDLSGSDPVTECTHQTTSSADSGILEKPSVNVRPSSIINILHPTTDDIQINY
ncbi:hypothetical protein BgiMline_015976 [Biomphalaria glabrata]|uniref:Uncharacterized protein LOC106060546 n=1 Tax=Biomphalaria glabrata TaxID=6526 RepID=A0A2C9M2H9_BIOGL|nr:uncharacterized protein LOC106060546 [Biomphalaria glabrata]XP_013073916.1 uncharacterized protein LOC106060546 [Biomphalaria glabrata]XP_055889758.1 uncharacterized protein LOC106060546 [Biomphalaria glabrata]XP_055889759.1 uncharacterized protein LOC106060546 [Biomphalaria glabrata]XP_055889760.1 uncharacterized protein LOC106060546 [Biomphalaria glabrata]XP_055889761.1 uncharacterized protein LOC106060546 [Biomphalaria glabrata]KAI8758159.1 hypothetical protein BgiMline_008783 [Biomphal